MRRSYDAAPFNAILNDASVFPFVAVAGMETIDVSEQVADPRNVLLMGVGGGIFFAAAGPSLYEAHNAFLKPDKTSAPMPGAYILNFNLDAYRFMFTHTDCVELITRLPAHRGIAPLMPLAGWQKEFERRAVWPSPQHGLVDCGFYSLRYEDWVRKTASLAESGRWFHARMEEECARLGQTDKRHAEEECHDRQVGACVEMIYGGQIEKAIICYNKWAAFAGYHQIALVSRSPLLIDIGDALIHILDDDFRVIKCRSPQQ